MNNEIKILFAVRQQILSPPRRRHYVNVLNHFAISLQHILLLHIVLFDQVESTWLKQQGNRIVLSIHLAV